VRALQVEWIHPAKAFRPAGFPAGSGTARGVLGCERRCF